MFNNENEKVIISSSWIWRLHYLNYCIISISCCFQVNYQIEESSSYLYLYLSIYIKILIKNDFCLFKLFSVSTKIA